MDGLLALIPALCSFIIGLITHRILLALAVGVLIAALLSSGGDPFSAAHVIGSHLLQNLELSKWGSLEGILSANKVFVIGFIVFSTALFELIFNSKGIQGLYKATASKIKTKRGVETASLLFSHSLFIDGCLSSLLVSSLMRPLGERFGVHKLKTALLADSMAGPLVALCPFSCFTAIVIGLLASHGVNKGAGALISANATELYLLSIPYLLYSLVVVLFFWLTVRLQVTVGSMRKVEGEQAPISSNAISDSDGNLNDFLVPALSMPLFILSWGALLGWKEATIWEMITNGPISLTLFLSSICSVIVSFCYYIYSGRFSTKDGLKHVQIGMSKSFASVMTIVLAWTLASILSHHLSLNVLLGEILGNNVGKILGPFFFFILSAAIATSLGTSWGTVAILVPLIAPTVVNLYNLEGILQVSDLPLLAPSLGAVISGAAFGDHASLLSDSTLLSCHGARCSPVEHIRTQWPYIAPLLFATSIGFLVAGLTAEFTFGWLPPLLVSLLITVGYVSYNKFTIGDKILS